MLKKRKILYLKLDNETIETVNETKLLGTTITNNLSWNKNTSILVREGNIRMQFLHKASKFTSNVRDLKPIYISQIRTKLEQSAVVWHSSLTKKNGSDLLREIWLPMIQWNSGTTPPTSNRNKHILVVPESQQIPKNQESEPSLKQDDNPGNPTLNFSHRGFYRFLCWIIERKC
mgnify:CR=1 FL=1